MLVLQVNLQQLVIAHYGFPTSNTAWIIGPIVNVGGNGLLDALGHLSVGSAVATWIIGQTLGMLILLQYVVRRSRGGRLDRTLAREQVTFGLKAQLPRLLTLSNYRMDQWLMGALTSATQLGYYSVAVAWAEALFFLPTSLAMVQRPDLVRAGREQAARDAAAIMRIALALTAVSAAVMILIAPYLCEDVFGDDFAPATGQLRVLVLGAFGIVALKLMGNALTAQGRPLRETVAVGSAFVVILVLDILLIPPHGGMGAAIASAVGYTGGGLVISVVAGRTLGFRPLDLLPRPSDLVTFAGRLRTVVSRA
jgi:O-antigen/teichoic acid export membrane protein